MWDDIWLPGTNSKIVPLTNINYDPELRVSDLCDYDTGGVWNYELINELFSEDYCVSMLDILLSLNWPPDKRFRYHTKNGEYTVRSGYWLVPIGNMHIKWENHGTSDETLWKIVWGL